MSIVQPNFTITPNTLLDYWLPKLSPASFKIIMVLCRKIFGWHKTSDSISKNQLCSLTGLTKNTVQSGIQELIKYGLVHVYHSTTEKGHEPNTFALAIEKPVDERYSEPNQKNTNEGSKSDPPPRSKFDPPPRSKFDPPLGQNLTPQKKEIKKEENKQQRAREKTPHPPNVAGNAAASFFVEKEEPPKREPTPTPDPIPARHAATQPTAEVKAELGLFHPDQPYLQGLDEEEVAQVQRSYYKKRDTITNPTGWIISCIKQGWYREHAVTDEDLQRNHQYASSIASNFIRLKLNGGMTYFDVWPSGIAFVKGGKEVPMPSFELDNERFKEILARKIKELGYADNVLPA